MDNGVLSLTQRSGSPSAPSIGFTNLYSDGNGNLYSQIATGTNMILMSNALNGWNLAGATWTYVSATSFTVAGDYSNIYTPGMKWKATMDSVVKKGYFTSVSYSSGTGLTTVGTVGDALTNHTITDNYYSTAAIPSGFPKTFTGATTWTNLTVGDASPNEYEYEVLQNGLVHFRARIVLGSTSSIGASSSVRITNLPIAVKSTYASLEVIGTATAVDNGGNTYKLSFTAAGYVLTETAMVLGNVQTTTPFTWASGDGLYIDAFYIPNW